MGETHPGRLGQRQVQFLLKVLVHHVNHSVAESPKSKQQDEQNEGEEDVPAIISNEHFLFRGGARIIERHRMLFGGGSIHDSSVYIFASWKVSFILGHGIGNVGGAVEVKDPLDIGAEPRGYLR